MPSPRAEKSADWREGYENVLVFGPLPFLTSGPTSWQPVKDLVRCFLSRTSTEDPTVNICDECTNGSSWAFVKLKNEENARRVFDAIAGHSWYGAVLQTEWLRTSLRPSPDKPPKTIRCLARQERPRRLELDSQITDKRLLRRSTIPSPLLDSAIYDSRRTSRNRRSNTNPPAIPRYRNGLLPADTYPSSGGPSSARSSVVNGRTTRTTPYTTSRPEPNYPSPAFIQQQPSVQPGSRPSRSNRIATSQTGVAFHEQAYPGTWPAQDSDFQIQHYHNSLALYPAMDYDPRLAALPEHVGMSAAPLQYNHHLPTSCFSQQHGLWCDMVTEEDEGEEEDMPSTTTRASDLDRSPVILDGSGR